METTVNRDGPWCYYCEEPIIDPWTAQRVTDGDGDVIAYAHPGCDGDDAFPATDLTDAGEYEAATVAGVRESEGA